MVEDFRWWVWGAGTCAAALAVAFGPLAAGFAFAGVALVFMFALMAARAARLIGDWRLEHPYLAHRRVPSRR
jgi:hypothetical protein